MGNNPDSPSVRKWTDAEIEYLFEAARAGKRLAVIAKSLGRTEEAISAKSKKLGIKLPSKRTAFTKSKQSETPAFSPWSPDERLKLGLLWKEGKSASDIAQALGRTVEAVRTQRKKLRLARRQAPKGRVAQMAAMYMAGHPVEDIAKHFGVSKAAVYHHLKRIPKTSDNLTDLEIEIIEERYLDGCTTRCIARRIGRSNVTVHRHIHDVALFTVEANTDALVRDLSRHGLEDDQISLKLGLPVYSIRLALSRIEEAGNG